MSAAHSVQGLKQDSRHTFGAGPCDKPLSMEFGAEAQFELELDPGCLLERFASTNRHATLAQVGNPAELFRAAVPKCYRAVDGVAEVPPPLSQHNFFCNCDVKRDAVDGQGGFEHEICSGIQGCRRFARRFHAGKNRGFRVRRPSPHGFDHLDGARHLRIHEDAVDFFAFQIFPPRLGGWHKGKFGAELLHAAGYSCKRCVVVRNKQKFKLGQRGHCGTRSPSAFGGHLVWTYDRALYLYRWRQAGVENFYAAAVQSSNHTQRQSWMQSIQRRVSDGKISFIWNRGKLAGLSPLHRRCRPGRSECCRTAGRKYPTTLHTRCQRESNARPLSLLLWICARFHRGHKRRQGSLRFRRW